MLLLKLTLVVLISVIGERALCTDSSAKENENAPETLPEDLLMIEKDSSGCNYTLLPYFVEATMDYGFLYVSCTKSCPEGKHETAVTGTECVAGVSPSKEDEVEVTVGSCDGGSCKLGRNPRRITVTLTSEEEEEEEQKEGEEKEEEKNKNSF
uniref:Putative secreted protein n=1 Tax=Ixodes ricinus TaxID=34613 RepID=A0A090X9H0_IXORI